METEVIKWIIIIKKHVYPLCQDINSRVNWSSRPDINHNLIDITETQTLNRSIVCWSCKLLLMILEPLCFNNYAQKNPLSTTKRITSTLIPIKFMQKYECHKTKQHLLIHKYTEQVLNAVSQLERETMLHL